MSIKKCLYCGDNLKVITTVHKEYVGDRTIVIKNIPMFICTNCVEEYLGAAEMNNIEKIIKSTSSNDNITIVDYNDF